MIHKIMTTFYVYVDWTTDDSHRAFYVGKGCLKRIRQTHRNKRHSKIMLEHGMKREIVLTTQNEQEAFAAEVRLIQEYHTFCTEGGANFTLGGDGATGSIRSEEQRSNLSNALKGHKHSEETKQKLSKARQKLLESGWRPIVNDQAKKVLKKKAKEREARKRERGYVPSLEAKKNMSEAGIRRWQTKPVSPEKLSEAAFKREARIQHLLQRQDVPSDFIPPTHETQPD